MSLNIDKILEKNFGKNLIQTGHAIIDIDFQIIPVSPLLDIILGGGIQEGSFVTLVGNPKCGKTTCSLDFASTCQKPEYGEREIYYFNIEGRLKKRDIKGIPNLNLDKFHVIGSTPGNILTAEKYLSIAELYVNNIQKSVIIIDSYSALCTDTELTTEMNQMQRADGAKLLAKFCRKLANIVPVNRNIIIGIVHLMGNPSGYGPALKEKSGQAIAYQVDTKLQALSFTPWKVNEKQIGQVTQWKCITSALGPPGQSTTSYIRYGAGIDKIYETINLGIELNIIEKSGAWYTFQENKIQGLEKVSSFFSINKEAYQQLSSTIKEMLK